MTQTQFNEIVQRAAQPMFGTPSQVKTDLADLISEVTRRDAAAEAGFEPEPPTEEAAAPEPAHVDVSHEESVEHDRAAAKTGARKK